MSRSEKMKGTRQFLTHLGYIGKVAFTSYLPQKKKKRGICSKEFRAEEGVVSGLRLLGFSTVMSGNSHKIEREME